MSRPGGERGPRGGGAIGDRDDATAPLLYVFGDDDLIAERLVARFAASLAAAGGVVPERWDLRADQVSAMRQVLDLRERLSTGTLFGGGTLAVVSNPAALVRRNDTRDVLLDAIADLAPGNALVLVEATRSNAKGPGSKRLTDAIRSGGGRALSAMGPRPASLASWIESEARERSLSLGPGASRELAERLGGRVTEGDVDRRHLSRIASMELDKLALRRLDGSSVTVEDVRSLVAETVPSSVWAFTDAVGDRRRDVALATLDRLILDTPEPVLLAVLHRRVAELLELGDRLAGGADLPTASRMVGVTNEFRARTLAAQARRWTVGELGEALHGLLELDAMVKGAPGSESDVAQRRLAFDLWVDAHLVRA